MKPGAAKGGDALMARETLVEGPLKVGAFFDQRRRAKVRAANEKGDPTVLREGRGPKERPDEGAFGEGEAASGEIGIPEHFFSMGKIDFEPRGVHKLFRGGPLGMPGQPEFEDELKHYGKTTTQPAIQGQMYGYAGKWDTFEERLPREPADEGQAGPIAEPLGVRDTPKKDTEEKG